MRLFKVILLILLFVCSTIFFIQNMETLSRPMSLHFDPLPSFAQDALKPSHLAWQGEGVPLYLVILVSFACGTLFAAFFFLLEHIRHAWFRGAKKRQHRALARERDRLAGDLAKAGERESLLEADLAKARERESQLEDDLAKAREQLRTAANGGFPPAGPAEE
ncbi:MAG: LapA family protein [Desulfovibrio sp.]|jgi:uncharacterized integral membrane protein|nr:LapA family protein [Desulfovibrio sp.]